MVGTKLVKNGQMCVSVDYCLVHCDEVDQFVAEAQRFMQTTLPDNARSSDCTGIISTRHLDRLEAILQEARDRQTTVIPVGPYADADSETRRMPLSLVIDPALDLRVMWEEIFGPILPIVPYDDLGQAIAQINAGERPLGLYVFTDDLELAVRILADTASGGAAVNTCAIQSLPPSMGFGGVGQSGMGRHHGVEGFRGFSNPLCIVVRGASGDMIGCSYPPYVQAEAVVDAALGADSSTRPSGLPTAFESNPREVDEGSTACVRLFE